MTDNPQPSVRVAPGADVDERAKLGDERSAEKVTDNPQPSVRVVPGADVDERAKLGNERSAGKVTGNPQASVRVAPGADVDERAKLGDGTSVWHLAQVREDAILGRNCVIGRGAYIGTGVRIGDNVKIQNYALVYEPATLGDGSFVGPAAVLTNDLRPRSVAPDGSQKRAGDWHAVGVEVAEGASIGARAVCVAPVRVGRWAMVGAGSVVTRDVPDFALVVGVPARRVGWVGKSGERLTQAGGDGDDIRWSDPATGETYRETPEGRLVESGLMEDSAVEETP